MISRVLAAACVAGFLAACVASLLQLALTTPLIVAAERFEAQASATGAAAHDHAGPTGHAAADEAWTPAEGLPRAAFTGLATLVSAVGYALVLAALILASGAELSLATALPWAVGGFLAVNLAPAVGLPPELPGMGGPGLAARQAWWLLTAAGTGIGLYLIAAVRSGWAILVGALVIALPHVVGAPHGAGSSEVPAALAASFAARSLAVAFLFWITLGAALGWAGARFARTNAAEAALA